MYAWTGLALVASLASITWLGLPSDAAAQGERAVVPPVTLDVRMIRAGTDEGRVDPGGAHAGELSGTSAGTRPP